MAETPGIGPVLELLNRRFGCGLDTAYYTKIEEWKHWWAGRYEPFHRRREWNGDRVLHRELYSLRMAKKVCEDWAAVLLNEKTEIVVDDPAGAAFLLGEDGSGGVLGENGFWRQGNALMERAFATGTGAVVLKLRGLRTQGEAIYRDAGTKITLEYLDAPCIIPLSLKAGQVTEAAFVSAVTEKGKRFIYLETHLLEGGQYVIGNEYFSRENGVLRPAPLPEGVAPRLSTGSALPWFALISPNLVNNLSGGNGLGLSIFANAIDNLKGVDLAFNNFCRDFKLGGKKVFYNKSLLHRDEEGRTVAPDDVAQQLFLKVGSEVADFGTSDLIHEFNPDLRIEDNRNGLQAQLDYLSFKCGFGSRRYQFQSDRIQTATEYMGSQQELVQNAAKHYIAVDQAIKTIARGILYAGKEFCGQPVNSEAKIAVNFEDSYIIDKESERQRDLQEVRDGILQKWEFRVKWYGEDEETARSAVAAPTDDQWMGFGKDGA